MKSLILALLCLVPLIALGQEGQITLQAALSRAYETRAGIRAARLRLSQAQASRRALAAVPPTRAFLGYSTSAEVGGTDGDAMIAQQIDIFGRSRAGRSVGDALVLQAQAALTETLVTVQTDVISLYTQTAASAALASTAQNTLQIVEQLENAVKQRVEGGVAPGVQAMRLSIEVERARAMSSRRQAELDANLTRLAAATGFPKDALVLSGMPDFEPQAAVAIEQTRPDLLALAAEVATAEADARLARTSSLPELELQGRRSPWQDQRGQYGARIQLSFPLWDGGKTRNEVSAASSRAEAARQLLADARAIAASEVDAARTEVAASVQEVSSFEKIVQTARLLVERTRTGLTEGASSLIEVLDALRALRETEETLIEARLWLAQAQGRLLHVTGQLVVKP